MPAERLPTRKVRGVPRQRYACGASERVIAQSLGLGHTAVGEYIRRSGVIGITWPVPGDLDDAPQRPQVRIVRNFRRRQQRGVWCDMPSAVVRSIERLRAAIYYWIAQFSAETGEQPK